MSNIDLNEPSTAIPNEHWTTVEGARVRYLSCGSGPSLVLLHGLLGYSFSWRYAMPVLARDATVYAVDMPGVGFSDRPQGLDCSLRGCSQRLLRFLDAVNIDTCDLLGTSHGGAVAMMAAARATERVRRLVLVAPVNPWSAHGRRATAILSGRAVAPLLVRLAPFLSIAHRCFLRRLYGDPRRIRPGTLKGYSAPFATPGALEYGIHVARTWNRDLDELASVLPQVATIPTLLIWGSKDKAVDPASASKLQQNFADCHLVVLPGIGHLPYEEAPEEFNRIVSNFIATSTRDSLRHAK